jgi:chromosome partitioning protein
MAAADRAKPRGRYRPASDRELPVRTLAMVSGGEGSGKTTLAAHLAVQAQLTGLAPVALVDLDPQPALADWFSRRAVAAPAVVRIEPADMHESLARLEHAGMAFVVADLPSELGEAEVAAIAACDFAIISTRIEPEALESVHRAVEAVEAAGRPFVFVVNGTGDDEAATAAVIALAQHGTLATTVVPEDEDIAEAMAAGETVMERLPSSQAAESFAMLWEYLSGRMDKALCPPAPAEALAKAGLERRRYPRIPLHERAMLLLDDAQLPCTVLDISAGGLALEADLPLEVGEIVTVSLPNVGKVRGEVRHARGHFAGLQFKMSSRNQWDLVKKLTELVGQSEPARE